MANIYKNFNFDKENCIILLQEKTFSRTKTGKSWKSKPETEKFEIVNNDFYNNTIQSIPLFNACIMGIKGYCHASWNYISVGYLPTFITSINPDKTKKHIRNFVIISKKDLLKNAGYREREVIENVTEWSFYDDTETLIELEYKDKFVVYDVNSKKYVC